MTTTKPRKVTVSFQMGYGCITAECLLDEADQYLALFVELGQLMGQQYRELREPVSRIEHLGAAHQFNPWDADDEGRARVGFIRPTKGSAR